MRETSTRMEVANNTDPSVKDRLFQSSTVQGDSPEALSQSIPDLGLLIY